MRRAKIKIKTKLISAPSKPLDHCFLIFFLKSIPADATRLYGVPGWTAKLVNSVYPVLIQIGYFTGE